jgi:hypothetical protein
VLTPDSSAAEYYSDLEVERKGASTTLDRSLEEENKYYTFFSNLACNIHRKVYKIFVIFLVFFLRIYIDLET